METETAQEEPQENPVYKEGIRLTKNSRGYSWDIRILDDTLNDETLKKLKDLDNKLREEYGNKSKEVN